MTRLSVNINKVALLRNSRGGDVPNVVDFARDCEAYGAQGITVHPRPDERHIRYADVYALKPVVQTELNIEGYPSERFLKMIHEIVPDQCTLVPDPPGVLTSDSGWDTIENLPFLKDVAAGLKERGIRVSLFLNPDVRFVEAAAESGVDRIEIYTGGYSQGYSESRQEVIKPHIECARAAESHGLGVNAGHDLNLSNLAYYVRHVHGVLEVSIGHALISDALYFGIQNVIGMYLRQLMPVR